MNNLTTTISFSIYSNKGVYALLLGSGISKPSGIPTGWDIIIDLIKKLAKLNKEKCLPTPKEWFKNKYHEDPDYSIILSKLVATPSERVNFLKQYLEPTQEERENNLKQPTVAHKAIARLVKKGYVKVIITTNFDRLIETALHEEGIEPTIIKHPNDIDGAIPLAHNNFTLIKINGDYLDSRFLNTKEELAIYEEKLHDFLLRIINEFGIICCGWSAKWDTGLFNIIKQSENFRYSSYWTHLGDCETELKELAIHRKGQTIRISNADSFFSEIIEKTTALETLNDNHPLTVDIAIAQLKKYLPRDDNKILLYELLKDEREKVYNNIRQIVDFSIKPHQEYLLPKLTELESQLKLLLPLVINGIYWCKPEQYKYFEEIISRIGEPPPNPPGAYFDQTRNFYYYPAFLLLYAIGITSIKVNKFDVLNNCFHIKIPELQNVYSNRIYIIEKVNSFLIEKDTLNMILNTRYHTPLSTYSNNILRPYFQEFIPNDNEYNDLFDVFEYLLSLNFIYLTTSIISDWAPYGQYQWRSNSLPRSTSSLLIEFLIEADQKKSEWLPLKLGMFDNDYSLFFETKVSIRRSTSFFSC